MEELDLKELFNIFWSKKLEIAIIIAIFLVIGIVYTFTLVTPNYESTSTIILAKSSTVTNGEEQTITATDLTLNQKLVSTYSELIKSKNILREVIDKLKIDKTEDSLKNNVTVSAVKDSDLIKISVKDENPEIACKVVEEIANVFIDKVANGVYNINNVQVWDKAEVPTTPCNVNHIKDLIIFIFIGIVVASFYVLISNMLDTTIKSSDEIEKKLNLSVLTTIPLYDFDTKIKVVKGGKK